MDIRHTKRMQIVQDLFAYTFQKDKTVFQNPSSSHIVQHLGSIDECIKKYAPKFPIEKIAKTDLSVLRLAVYELQVEKKEPEKVIINEAIELAKEFGGEKSFSFINAVLGKLVKK